MNLILEMSEIIQSLMYDFEDLHLTMSIDVAGILPRVKRDRNFTGKLLGRERAIS